MHVQVFATKAPLRVRLSRQIIIHVDLILFAGKLEIIEGVQSYVATPTVDYPKEKIILYLSDVFGHQLINCQVPSISMGSNLC